MAKQEAGNQKKKTQITVPSTPLPLLEGKTPGPKSSCFRSGGPCKLPSRELCGCRSGRKRNCMDGTVNP